MLRAAYGLEAPPVGELSRPGHSCARGRDAARRRAAGVERARRVSLDRRSVLRSGASGGPAGLQPARRDRSPSSTFSAPARAGSKWSSSSASRREASRAVVTSRRSWATTRAASSTSARARGLTRPDHVARDRYLFYTACTRPSKRLYLVREAATDEGSPREPSPFWDEVQAVFPKDDVARWTRRRPLSALTWPLEEAPTDRERLRAVAIRAADDSVTADAIATANGWDRRLARALRAFDRPTRLTHPQVPGRVGGEVDVRRHRVGSGFADCSSIWFLEPSDRSEEHRCAGRCATARIGRAPGVVQVLFRPGRRNSARIGSKRIAVEDAGRLPTALPGPRVEGVRLELTDLQERELRYRAVARSRGVRPRRSRRRHAARSAPLRGPLRIGALRARAPARGSSSPRG